MIDSSSTACCQLLKLLHKQFLCCYAIDDIIWSNLFEHFSDLSYEDCLKHQDSLLNLTVEFPLIKKLPVKPTYQLAFLKKILNKAEEADIAHPAIYDSYVSLLTLTSKESSEYYKHFIIGKSYITIQESSSIISKGTTGLCTWEAAIYLADWCISQKHLIEKKNVLELGCGVGFTGIALCSSEAAPSCYTFSDCHPEVLKQLRKNIELNSQIQKNSSLERIPVAKVNVLHLDWEDELEGIKKSLVQMPDIILASDVVYDQQLFKPLCKVLKYFLSFGATAFVACTLRNEDTIGEFNNFIVSEHFEVERESTYNQQIFLRLPHSSVNIYKMKYKLEDSHQLGVDSGD